MVYIPTKIQLADVFTKPLAHQVFTVHVDTLFGVPPVGQLKEYLYTIDQQRQAGVPVSMYQGQFTKESEGEEYEIEY
jgi:hypothetical protein